MKTLRDSESCHPKQEDDTSQLFVCTSSNSKMVRGYYKEY